MSQKYSEYITSQLKILKTLTGCAEAILICFENSLEQNISISSNSNSNISVYKNSETISFLKNTHGNKGYTQDQFSEINTLNTFNFIFVAPIFINDVHWGVTILLFDTSPILDEKQEFIEAINHSIENYLLLTPNSCSSNINAQLILETMKGIPWQLDFKTGEFKFIGSQIQELLGYKPSEWPTIKEWADTILPSDRKSAVDFCTTQSLEGKDHIFEYRVSKKDGSIIWVRDVVKVITDSSNNPTELLGFIIDISDLKQNEEEITKLNNQLKFILNSTNTTLNIVDENLDIIFHSGNDASIISKKCFEYFCNFDSQCTNCPALSKKNQPSTFFRTLNDSTYQVTAFPILTENGKTHIAEVRVDISDRVQKENKINELNEKLEFSMNTGKIAYIEYNLENHLFTCNKYFKKLTGYDFNNTYIDLEWIISRIHPTESETFRNNLGKIIEGTKRRIDSEYRFLDKNNKYLWIHFLGQIDNKDKSKLVGVIIDITENKNLLVELIDARNKSIHANELKSKFLANMSHEIRTPMNAIIGFTNILDKHITQEPLKKYISSIKSSGKVLLELINDLLDLEKINSGKMELRKENTNIDILIDEIKQTFSLFAFEKNIELFTSKQTLIPQTILIDSLKIKQVLLNIVNNALKFTKQGHVRIDYSFFYVGNKNKGTLNISVSDTGIGISQEKQKIIFEPFIQEESTSSKEHKGTGLGLSIVQKLINLMGGTIILESELNKGSKFIISIPNVKASEVLNDEIPENKISSASKPSEVSLPISIDQLSQVEQLLVVNKFNNSLIPLWIELSELISMKKLQTFYEQLDELIKQVKWPELIDFTKKLDILINSFDFEELPKQIKKFESFISGIKTNNKLTIK